MMRWPAVERVWLPAWISHKEAVLDKLEAAFTKAAESSSSNAFESGAGGDEVRSTEEAPDVPLEDRV